MSQPSLDRCPRCGSPYMSSMLPNETTESRYCYTCATVTGGTKIQNQNVEVDDLELQPLDEAPSSSASASKPRGRIPQIAPSRKSTRTVRPPTAAPQIRAQAAIPAAAVPAEPQTPAAAPARVSGSALPVPPAAPVAAGGASGTRRAISSHTMPIPQIAPSGAHGSGIRPNTDRNAFPVKLGVGVCAAGLLAVVSYYMLKSNPNTPVETVAVNTSPKVTAPAVTKTPATNSAVSKTVAKPVAAKSTTVVKPPEKEPESAPAKPFDVGASVGFSTGGEKPLPGPAALQQDEPRIAVKPGEKTSEKPATDVTQIIGKAPRPRAAGDDEEVAVAKVQKPKTPDAPAKKPDEVKPEGVAEAQPAVPPANPANPAEEMDEDGKPKKKKRSILDGPEEKKPEAKEPDKKENPFAVKIIPVTATEPTIMPLDITKVGGNDLTMTQQLIAFLPDWRVRDAAFDISKIGIAYSGREQVVAIAPMNDVLPAKLIATVEIPKSFAGQRPVLKFEVGSALNAKPWALSVHAMNADLVVKSAELLPKTAVKLPKDNPWLDVTVDLTPLADKHFDLQIEVSGTVKRPKGGNGELGYIRNVRIEWTGKKK